MHFNASDAVPGLPRTLRAHKGLPGALSCLFDLEIEKYFSTEVSSVSFRLRGMCPRRFLAGLLGRREGSFQQLREEVELEVDVSARALA